MNGSVTTAVVVYVGVVALLAVAAALGAPVEAAARSGFVIAQLGVAVLVLVDLATLLGGHRPEEMTTHIGYALAAPAVPLLVAGPRRDEPTPLPLVALAMVVVGVVVVRLGQTW